LALSFSLTGVAEIISLRHDVLRAGKPIETCYFKGDTDKDALHFSVTRHQQVVGCVSFIKNTHPKFQNTPSYQLRGMAVSPHLRGKQLGSKLLTYAEQYLKTIKENFIWCNVRQNAIPFYQKHGYRILGDVFEIDEVGPHVLMFKHL